MLPLALLAFSLSFIPALAANASDLPESMISAAWYTGWHADDFPLSDVSWEKYTHLKYAFACVNCSYLVFFIAYESAVFQPETASTFRSRNPSVSCCPNSPRPRTTMYGPDLPSSFQSEPSDLGRKSKSIHWRLGRITLLLFQRRLGAEPNRIRAEATQGGGRVRFRRLGL